MAKRKIKRRAQRRARGGAEAVEALPLFPGVEIIFADGNRVEILPRNIIEQP